MKELKPTWMFIGGTMFGLMIALCLGAVPKAKSPPAPVPAPVPKKDWSQLKIFSYPNGGTGIFDPETGTFYSYDADLIGCYQIRELSKLGDRMYVRR